MTQIEIVQFRCPNCDKRLTARAEQAGRLYACPGCGQPVPVPQINAAPPVPSVDEWTPAPPPPGFLRRAPSSVLELLGILLIAWASITALLVIVCLFGDIARYLAIVLILVVTLVALEQALRLLRARQSVLAHKDISLCWGMVRLIAWDPTEGVLILKNKSVSFSDDDLHDGTGGVKFIYPSLGEELALRVPLETQTLSFDVDHVLTREYLHLSIRGQMKWRIDDIERFYLLVSRDLRGSAAPSTSRDEMSTKLINAAVEWLRGIATEQIRSVVSRVQSGLLIADKLSAELGGATEGLASAIHDTIGERLKGYGILVLDVSLQEIRMPEAIVRQSIKAARTAYLPLMNQREATGVRENLQAQADVIGKEALAAKEIVGSAPNLTAGQLAAGALRDFLTDFVAKQAPALNDPEKPVPTIDVASMKAIEEK